MCPRYSEEFYKGVSKHWSSPREREKLAEAMRKKDAWLDKQVALKKQNERETGRRLEEEMAERVESTVHDFKKRGHITGGARKIFTSSHS